MFKHNLTAVLNTQRPNKDSLYPIRIRATIQRKVTYYPTGLMVKKDQFKKGEVISHPNKALYNMQIRARVSEIEKTYMEQSMDGSVLTKIVKRDTDIKFCDFAEKIIRRNTGTMSKGTIKQKNVYLKKFREFKPAAKLKDIDKSVLSEFENWCRTRKGNNDNSVWGNSKFVKSIINVAVQDGVLKTSPLNGFKGTKYKDPLRIVLTAEEIKKIETYADSEKNLRKLKEAAAWFLFMLYTGLRYGDLVDFKGFVNGKVMLQTMKTGEIVSIFATQKIKEARARLTNPVVSNQKMNDYLKLVALACEIDKGITCHIARHTFAVEYLIRGGDIYVLKNLLGHTSLKTTEIYARLAAIRMDQEMKKVWDK